MSPGKSLFRAPSYAWGLALLFAFSVTFWFMHGYYAFVWPTMACEDGELMFANYLMNPSITGIFRFYFGYISLLPNLIGYLSARLPPTWNPYLLAYCALLLKGAAHTIFALRRFRGVVAADSTRWLICLVLAALPLGDVLMFDNTTYSLWNMLWILLLLVYAPLGQSRSVQVGQFILMALFACSHPLSVVAIPLCLYNLYTRRQPADYWVNGGLIIVIGLYLALGVAPEKEPVRSLIGSVFYTPLYLLNRVVFEALFTYHFRLLLQTAGLAWVIYSSALLIVGGLGFWYWRQRHTFSFHTHLQLWIVLYVIVALTWLSVYSRAMNATSHMGAWNLRYFYIQQYLFWLILLIAIYPMLNTAMLKAGATVLLVGYLVFTNYISWDYLRTWPEDGWRLAEFLQQVEAYQHSGPHAATQEFLLKRDCFDIVIKLY